jgi:pimeloyl-ACP methyl ester carboxylesterase
MKKIIRLVRGFMRLAAFVGLSAALNAVAQSPKSVVVPLETASTKTTSDNAIQLQTATALLHGSLMLPVRLPEGGTAATKPLSVVIIHPGSGPTDRDGNSAGLPGKNNSLKMLAEALAQRGIASVRIDKRGVAESGAAVSSEKDLRFDTYIDDLVAWITMLKKDPRFSRVIVAGHSEGSLVGMMAAAKSSADAFISLSGIASNAGDVLRTQLKPKLPEALWNESERTLKSLEAGKLVDDPPAALASLYRPSVQPYLISWLNKRPTIEIAKLKVPILIVQGTTDIQVATREAELLKAAAPKAELAIIDGMNHVLKKVEADQKKQLASYSDATLPLHDAFAPLIVAFVNGLK